MLQRDYPGQVCSIARALEVIGERWTLLILRDAVLGLTRFEDFQESLGVASNTLTNRLKLLCDEDVLERVPDPQRPGRPKYVLTEKGRELGPALIVLLKWGDRHYPTPDGPPRLAPPPACGRRGGPSPRRAPEARPPRRLRRQRRPRSPLRPLRPAGHTRRDRPPARTGCATKPARATVTGARGRLRCKKRSSNTDDTVAKART